MPGQYDTHPAPAQFDALGPTISAMCNFEPPYDHSRPVQHLLSWRVPDYPDECLWAQLQEERANRDRDPGSYGEAKYLENLEIEWLRRNICSRCHRELDRDLATQFTELKDRAENAEQKLGEIRAALAKYADVMVRPEIGRILDRP